MRILLVEDEDQIIPVLYIYDVAPELTSYIHSAVRVLKNPPHGLSKTLIGSSWESGHHFPSYFTPRE